MRLLDQIQNIKKIILEKNTYFNNGYAVAFSRGDGVYYYNGNSYINMLPNDTLGNYFYIKGNDVVSHNTAIKIADCLGSEYNDVLEIKIVAIVKEANTGLLIGNIRNTLSSIKNININLLRTLYVREQVVINELRGIKQDELNKTLQRLKNETIISITANIQDIYYINDCIVDPCKKCNTSELSTIT